MDVNVEPGAHFRIQTPFSARLSWTHRWEPSTYAPPKYQDLQNTTRQRIGELDFITRQIVCESADAGVRSLRVLLASCRAQIWSAGWQVFARSVIRDHPILDLIHQSPVSSAIFDRPASLDPFAFFSSALVCPNRSADRSAHIAAAELDGDTPRAIRDCRRLLSRAIGETWAANPTARILNATRGMAAGVGADLICVAGVLESLPDGRASQLLSDLFTKLAPRGRLLAMSIDPAVNDRAYLEACMDLWLVYRDETAIRRLLATIRDRQIASVHASRAPNAPAVVLDVVRA